MEARNPMNDRQMIFGSLFVLPNKLQKLMDRDLSPYDMTSKQWFLSVVIDNLFQKPPTLNDVAKAMGYSHQNVKQIAAKLENKGFLIIEKDKRDQRALRIKLTEKSIQFWGTLESQSLEFMNAMFEGLSEEELTGLSISLQKVIMNLEKMEKEEVEED